MSGLDVEHLPLAVLTYAVMRHYGYTDADIAEAEQVHPGRVCDEDCRDEDDKSLHPIRDELEATASVMVEVVHPFLLDHIAGEQARVDAAVEARLAPIRAIHKPIRVYDECEHDADHGCEPIEVYDYTGCSESIIGWGCAVCCYDDEYPREDCPHGADHWGVSEEQSCPTRAALRDATHTDAPEVTAEGAEGER